MDKYVTYYAANDEYRTHKTFEDAEQWLREFYCDDIMVMHEFTQETVGREDFIATITHRSDCEAHLGKVVMLGVE